MTCLWISTLGWRSDSARLSWQPERMSGSCIDGGDAFFYTTGVRGLDCGMHMMVWVSMWDAAIRHMLDRRSLFGSNHESEEHAVVARRLRGASDPGWIVAVPVVVGESVEAVVELGRFGKGFAESALRQTTEAMHAAL